MANLLSNRGKRKLEHENHIYTFSKRTADESNHIWVCEKRSTCNGRVWTDSVTNDVVRIVTGHTHAAQAARPEAIRVVNHVYKILPLV